MPKPNSIDQLPEDVRAELAAGLKGSGWGNIDRWTEWLAERGYEIGRSTVGRFNKRTKDSFKAAWDSAEQTAAMAKILVANRDQDGGAVLQANELLASDGLLRMQLMMRDLEALADELESVEDATNLRLELAKAQARFSRSVADLNRAGIVRAKWQEEVDAKLQKAAVQGAAIAKKAGLSDADWAAIRANFLGVEVESPA